MGKQSSTIIINGQRYHRTLEGVVSNKKIAAKSVRPLASAAKQARPQTIVSKPIMDVARHPGKTAGRHPSGSTTLMRTSVKKPAADIKRRIKLIQPAGAAAVSVKHNPQPVRYSTEEERSRRAAEIKKSHLIKHFTPLTAIKPQLPDGRHSDTAFRPVKLVPSHVFQKVQQRHSATDIFQSALQKASSHEQKPVKFKRSAHRGLKLTAGALCALVLLGAVAYLNLGNLKLRLAASRAGFAATMPSVKPAGYHLDNLQAQSGMVATAFKSNSDNNRRYTITQKTSDMTSTMLRDQVFKSVPGGSSYQTVEAAGRTVFLYGNRSATWVNGGVLYKVESNGSLSNQQLLEIAASM